MLPTESLSSLQQKGSFLPLSHEGEPFESLPSHGQGGPVRSSPAVLQVQEWKDLVTLGPAGGAGNRDSYFEGQLPPATPVICTLTQWQALGRSWACYQLHVVPAAAVSPRG